MKSKEKIEAIKLRKLGHSIRDIAKKLNVSIGTVSVWCRPYPLAVEQIKIRSASVIAGRQNKVRWENLKKTVRDSYEPPLNDPLFMLGIGLYWGEGTKVGGVALSNCDAGLLKQFINWISNYFAGDFTRFVVSIHHYNPEKDIEIKKKWSEELNLSLNLFNKSIFAKSKSSNNKRGHVQPFGTAHVICRGKNIWKIKEKISKAFDLLNGPIV